VSSSSALLLCAAVEEIMLCAGLEENGQEDVVPLTRSFFGF